MATRLKTGGRQKGTPNKITADLKKLAGEHGPEAVAAILTIARTAESETTRLAAWRELLDRGYGKPAQYSEIGSKGGAPRIAQSGFLTPISAIRPKLVARSNRTAWAAFPASSVIVGLVDIGRIGRW